ncbi:MAG: Holliday junction resolvase RuvX [Anaerolineae bacterium]|nr:Holliday junction resolvase RuvX [Anaerolineae bacterium]
MYCLALDIGEKRTGVAIGEVLARPLATLRRRSKVQDFEAIGQLVRQHGVDTVVVGLPLNMDGSQGFQAQKVARYAALLEQALDEMGLSVQVVLWDERLSTDAAQRALAEIGSGAAVRGRVDQVAAALILQSYLDRMRDTES